jgi:hypothetical protein
MSAGLLFWDPNDVTPAMAELSEQGFDDFEVLSEIDDEGPTIFLTARITLDMDDHDFFQWIGALVEPLGGDAWTAGTDHDPPAPAVRGRLH